MYQIEIFFPETDSRSILRYDTEQEAQEDLVFRFALALKHHTFVTMKLVKVVEVVEIKRSTLAVCNNYGKADF